MEHQASVHLPGVTESIDLKSFTQDIRHDKLYLYQH